MKIQCKCGAIIYDSTDNLPYKAYIIGDKDWDDYHETIDDAIMQADEDKRKTIWEVRRTERSRLAYECNNCGRLYLNNSEGKLVEYIPANHQPNRIFDRNIE